MGDIIGLVAVASPFVFAILVVFFVFRYDFRKRKEKYDVVKKAVENNYRLPDSFFQSEDKRRKSPLDSSMTLICLGVGLFIPCFLANMPGDLRVVVVTVASILLLLGLGRLLAWNIDRKANSGETKQNREE